MLFLKKRGSALATETLGSKCQLAESWSRLENTTDTLASGVIAHLRGESLKGPLNPAFPHLTSL